MVNPQWRRNESIISPLFHWDCYRYIEINCESEYEIISLESLFIGSTIKKDGDFACSNDIFNQLYKAFILDTFISHIDETGLVKRFDAWNFYEWTEGLCYYEEPSYHAPINALLYGALECWCKVSKQLTNNEKKCKYKKAKNLIRLAFDKNFWNEEKGVYASYLTDDGMSHYAEYTQAVILWSGLANGRRAKELCKILKSENNLIKISLSSNYFKYDGLIKHKRKNLKFVIEDIKDRWGKMLFDGATSFYETELGEKDFDNAGSLCHGWSALPIYIMGKYLLKIKNKKK